MKLEVPSLSFWNDPFEQVVLLLVFFKELAMPTGPHPENK